MFLYYKWACREISPFSFSIRRMLHGNGMYRPSHHLTSNRLILLFAYVYLQVKLPSLPLVSMNFIMSFCLLMV